MVDPNTVACTVVTRADLVPATVLACSYLDHNPTHDFVVLVLDGASPAATPSAMVGARRTRSPLVADVGRLGLDKTDFLRLATSFTADELAHTLGPVLLGRLLAEYDVAIWLSPYGQVLGQLGDIAHHAQASGLVLTPLVLEPLTDDGKEPGPATLAAAGPFDAGFVAVGADALPFLAQWAEQARWRRTAGIPAELVASRPHHVIRDPGLGVAYWNLHQRPLDERGDGVLTAGGAPLRLLHLPGYRPDRPWLLSECCPKNPRVLLSDDPMLRRLCATYGDLLLAVRGQPIDYRYGTLPNGTEMTLPMRRVYHDAWRRSQHPSAEQLEFARAVAEPPPHPFRPDGGSAFVRWLTEPESPVDAAAGMNRLVMWLWRSRTDLQATFPTPNGGDAAGFRVWCRAHGLANGLLPDWAIPVGAPPPGEPEDTLGVNIAGNLTAELGIGQMARIVHQVAERTGLPVASVTEEYSISCRTALDEPASAGRPRFPISVITVNGDFTELLLASHPEVGHHRYRIGLWAWELDDFPESQRAGFAHVDEVWTVSEFVRQSIAAHSPVPVKVFPVPVADPGPPARSHRQPDDPVTFLFSFDFNSTAQRKNPWGVVEAFRQAFAGRDNARLVLKATNGALHVAALERLRMTIGDDRRIELLDDYLSVAELAKLYTDADAYVSLHRSEGFGLTVAEAMARGLPVIATDYSSTTEFFDGNVGWAIPYRLVDVEPGWPPYLAGRWADPDPAAAAQAMREVADNPEEAARRGRAARARILSTRTFDAAADWMRAQLEDAYRTWRGSVARKEPAVPDPNDPLERAREALQWRADPGVARRTPLAPALRKAVLRALDHYDMHQRRVLTALLDGMVDSAELLARRIDDEGQARQAGTDELQGRLDLLTAQLARLERAIVERAEGR